MNVAFPHKSCLNLKWNISKFRKRQSQKDWDSEQPSRRTLFGSGIIGGASAETGERVHKIPCITKYDFQNLIISSVKATILSNIFAVGLSAAETLKKAQKSCKYFWYK